jgi:PAS domain S-box-containing protein
MSEVTVAELLAELHEMRERLSNLRDSEDARGRAEEALRQSEMRFRDLVEQSLGLICTHDLDGVLLSINPAAAHALGYDPEEGIGIRLREFLSPSTRHLFDKYLQRVRQNGIDTGLMRVVTKDGTERIWMYRNVRIADPDAPPHVVGHALDITDRIKAEEALRASEQNLKRAHDDLERRVQERTAQLLEANDRLRAEAVNRQQAERDRVELLHRERQARQEAETANRLKDEFLAAVSHELRTPLTVILGWVQLAKGGQVSADRHPELLARIGRNAETLARLVNDLLDISRMVSGRYTLDLGKVPVLDVLETSIESLRPSAEAKHVAIESRLASDTGEVHGDATRLQQVIWNLLSNAVKYTPAGGTVWLSSERTGRELEIRVHDTGEGISPEFLPNVFEPFRQASAGTTRTGGGLGLGLAIVRHLVELHGGTVRAESPGLGQGATFVVVLPVAGPGESAATPQRAQRAEHAAEVVRLDGVRVLVVEDDRECRELVHTILESAGAQITAVSSAREAIDTLMTSRADVLVSDIGMPDEDGFALIGKIRSLEGAVAKIPALALTGYAQFATSNALIPGRFQRIALKPIEPQQLVAMVAALASNDESSESL